MSNCTGYSINPFIDLCTTGPVGNGNTANLSVQVSSAVINRSSSSVTVPDWDGSEVVVDLTNLVGNGIFNISDSSVDDTCDVISAQLTITPDTPSGSTGVMMLEIVIDNCIGNMHAAGIVAATTTPSPTTTPGPTTTPAPPTTTTSSTTTIDQNCGSPGPHTLSEMMAFDLNGGLGFCVS